MGRPFTFVHAADLHLDTPFEDVGRVPEPIFDALRDASLRAFERLIDLTIERGAEFLLLAGDLYDGPERGIRAQLHFRRGIERLAEREIRVFIAYGNHDPLEGWPAIASWPPGVTVFGAGEVARVPVERGGRRLATVHGVSYARRECAENLSLGFSRGNEPGLHIGLLHANAGGHPAHAPCAPASIDDLRRAGLDYWALGHVHQRSYPSRGAPWIVYPGSLQGRRRAPAELGAKGAVVVGADENEILDVQFAALDAVRLADVEVDLHGVPNLEVLCDHLAARSDELAEDHAGDGLVLTAVLTGRRAPSFHAPGTSLHDELLDALRREAAGRAPFVWWAAVEDLSEPEIDAAAILRRGDLTAALLRCAAGLAGDRERGPAFVDRRCEALLGRWVDELAPDEAEALLDEARDLALDLLRRPRDR